MKYNDLLKLTQTTIKDLCDNLMLLQNKDGGFKGYHIYDKESGIWTTSEILHIISKIPESKFYESNLKKASQYLIENQNKDGGFPFRSKGKSITDITAWVCLSLINYQQKEVVKKGIKFILKARYNDIVEDKGGWGLTTFEQDRIYSSWISIYCLRRYLNNHIDWFSEDELEEINLAINESKEWIKKSMNNDGGWGAMEGEPTNPSSTAVALLALFIIGENPKEYLNSYKILEKTMSNGLWELRREIVVTQEGYELTQEWFTSIFCFRAMIFFSEMDVNNLKDTHNVFINLLKLIENSKVKPSIGGSSDMIWPIPFLIEGIDKYRLFVKNKKKDFLDFLSSEEQKLKSKRKQEISELLKEQFPFPISQVFTSFEHELDYHRKFRLLIQLYEVIIKYAAIVNISFIISQSEKEPLISQALTKKLKRPSLGDWVSILITSLKESAGINKILSPFSKEDILKKSKNFLDESKPTLSLIQSLSEIVELRNSWTGHGAVRSVYEYKLEIDKQLSTLYTLLNRMSFLSKCNSFLILSSDYNEFGDGDIYKIRVFNGLSIQDNELETPRRLAEGQKDEMIRYIYFHNIDNNTITNLYPFLSYMFCGSCKRERFFFYNSTKNNGKISYLSFECGHTVECSNNNHFEKRLSAIDVKL